MGKQSFWDKPIFHKLFGTTPGDGDIQPKEAVAYSIAGFGQNFICTIIGSYLTVFMTDALGFDLNATVFGASGVVAVAWLMLGTRIFDALNDPIMGSIVDRTRTKWGKCRPYLKWMAIPIAAMTILCFLPFYPSNNVGFALVGLVYVIWSVVYTIADVPYWGLSTAMVNDTTKRGNMLTVARLFCTAGAGLVTILMPQITNAITSQYKYDSYAVITPIAVVSPAGDYIFDETVQSQYLELVGGEKELKGEYAEQGYKYGRFVIQDDKDNPKYLTIKYGKNGGIKKVVISEEYYEQGYRSAKGNLNPIYANENQNKLKWTYFVAAIILVVVAIPMFYYGFKNTKERCAVVNKDEIPSFGHNIKLLFKNDQLMLIVLSGVLGAARMVYTYTGGLYFCKYALANEAAYSLLTMLVVPGGLVASVLTPYFTKKLTKKWTYIISHVIGAVAMILMYFMWDFGSGSFRTGGLVVSIICMVLIGIPQGINNIVTYAMIGDTVEYLEWKTGERAEGICFAMQTLINKIGMAAGAFLGALAYGMSKISPKDPVGSMSVSGLNKLWNMLVLSGVISFVACIIPMLFYKITENKQRELVAIIEERKAKAMADTAVVIE